MGGLGWCGDQYVLGCLDVVGYIPSMSKENSDCRLAARRGKSTLYKFRPYQTEDDRKRVREIIVERKIYFSRASQINDPFDLSPRIEIPTREELIAGAERYFRNNPEKSVRRERTIRHLTFCDLPEYIRSVTEKIRGRIENHYSIFSLAGNRDHPMLWSHYAAGHSGLCIHFHSNEQSIFGGALRVKYGERRPMLPIELFSGPERDIFERVLLTKGVFWEYEEEYRWIRFPDTDWSDLPISFKGQHAHFHPGALSGISVGARMPDSDIAEMLELAAHHDPQLPVWRAVERDSFEFNFEQIG